MLLCPWGGGGVVLLFCFFLLCFYEQVSIKVPTRRDHLCKSVKAKKKKAKTASTVRKLVNEGKKQRIQFSSFYSPKWE